MERTEQLWPGGPRVFYDTGLFPPGTDSFALGYFAAPRPRDAVCDLGSGTGLLGALLLARQSALRLCCVELDPRAAALCRRTMDENGWDAQVRCGDLRARETLPPAGSMDYVISNPPYFRSGSGPAPRDPARRAAREESGCTLEDICAAAAYVLRWDGRFALVHRPERLTDVFAALRAAAMEPKRLRFLTAHGDAAPSLVLLEARRGGKSGLAVLPPLVIGSDEWQRVYFRDAPSV